MSIINCQLFKGLLKPLNRVFVLNDLDGIGLCDAAWNKLELGIVAEVLEALAGSPAHIDLLDILGIELVRDACALGLEFSVEGAKILLYNRIGKDRLKAI